MARYNVDLQDNEGNAYQIMANPDSVAEFSPAANRENIRSGETYRVIFGKIMKYLSEVGNAAYVGLANNCTTTIAGFALDARQGKELMDRINELNRDLNAINDNGAIKGLDAREDGVYITYSPAGGADTVTKKLGSGTVSISNYIFNFNVSTSGNGSSSGNQGRSGKSEFILNTEDYETLTIGSYKIEGDGAHAAWNPRDCVALSVTINGIKTTVGEGGHAFDVKSADTAIISASFGTNGNPDYGTWATLTVSSIILA